jgi:proteasome lid subunit RPN8/RPN11
MSLGATCTGEVCAVEIRDCGDRPVIGSIHTHPHSQPYPARNDIFVGISEQEKVMCVCGSQKAPGIAIDLEKPAPFEDLACRCLKLDKNKEAYERVKEIYNRYKPEIDRQVEQIKEINRQLEREGKPWRRNEDAFWTEAYQKALKEADRHLDEVLFKSEYKVFKV